MQQEIWKRVAWLPRYEVSNMGRVRDSTTGRIKLPTIAAETGFPVVNLYSVSGTNVRNVHSIVAEAFVGPRAPGDMVVHIDGNRRNCAASNLRYEPLSSRRAKRASAESPSFSPKLTAEQAAQIRTRANYGESVTLLAAEFGISPAHVSGIKNGRKWKEARAASKN
jgi:hypothetical protein